MDEKGERNDLTKQIRFILFASRVEDLFRAGRPLSLQDIIQSRASSSLSLTRHCNILRETKIKSNGIDWYVASLLRSAT